MLDLQGELPMEGWLNVTKSVGDDVFCADGYDKGVCRRYGRRAWKLPIGLWGCSSLSREDSFTFSLVI